MYKRMSIVGVTALLVLTGCTLPPPAAAPGNHVTFYIEVFRSINEQELNVPVHVTIKMEPPKPDLIIVDKNSGMAMTFPFEVPGDPNVPGSYPLSPVIQPIYFDRREPDEFKFTAIATLTEEFGVALSCKAYDRDGLRLGVVATKYIDHLRDTITVECYA